MNSRSAAFFDVDDTLIAMTSMFRFLAFDLAARGESPDAFRVAIDELGRLKAAGQQREETNRAFYRNFAGRDTVEIMNNGRAWFAAEHAAGGLFVQRTHAAFVAHARQGDLTVLVSGSFLPCLDPISVHLGADVVLCTQLEIVDGIYSGEITTPMIGAEKARAAVATAAQFDIDLVKSHAYGDHLSDLPLLEMVGHPVAVGNNSQLGHIADSRGWRRLAEAACHRRE
jgi:HAD superfamily hydrolase (TIGR01490 family)